MPFTAKQGGSAMSDRTVTTDALATLGTIIDDKQKRDAIHLAVFPAVAGSNLRRGEHVKLDSEGLAVCAYDNDGIGIVDPFLPIDKKEWGIDVLPGQHFWVVIYPRQINSLRHVWTHPAFPEELQGTVPANDRDESRKFLERFATRLFSYSPEHSNEEGSRFEILMRNAESGCFGTDIEYGDDCSPNDEFWMHYEKYTGRTVKNKPEYFRCSC